MATLLVIDSSGRTTRSITRHLTRKYAEQWRKTHPSGQVVFRDVGQHPPSPVDERWIAAAFADPGQRYSSMERSLSQSEQLLHEIEAADTIVMGVPVYNFGVPAQLKAWFDQVIRVNRSFSFDPNSEDPYRPLLADRPVTLIVSAGDGSLLPGGEMEHLNHQEPHLTTMLNFIGLQSLTFIRVGYDEFQDQRLERSLLMAEQSVHRLASSNAIPV